VSHMDAVQYRAKQCRRVVEIARQVILGTLGVIEGSRELSQLRHAVSDNDHDPDFSFFVALDSETDDLPLGSVRTHWAAYALAKKDEQIRRIEADTRDEALQHCERLVLRFGVGHQNSDG